MKVKTMTGPTIHAALAEARMILGDDVVLLESVAPSGKMPARVTVMVDEQPSAAASFAPAPAAPSMLRGGYGATSRPAASAAEANTVVSSTPRLEDTARREDAPRARGSLFPAASASAAEAPAAGRPGASSEPVPDVASMVASQFKMLNERLSQFENTFGERVIGSSMQWAAHPLFGECLQHNLQPATTARLFDRVAAQGLAPDADAETLRWALAREMRKLIDVAAPKTGTGTMLLLGPGGSGKTSLALKLARHPSFFGRRKTTAIVIQPEEDAAVAYLNPVPLYHRFEVPVQSVSTPEQMVQALERADRFDQILIDTPPMPVQEAEARKMILAIKRITEPVFPLQVHLVLSATRALDAFNQSFFSELPVRPDAVSLTHLDECGGWGRIVEWIAALRTPVQYVSNGRRIPDGLVAFSAGWFVEEMMQF